MTLKKIIDEAYVKGCNIKEDLISEVFGNKKIKEFLNSDIFVAAISKVIQTRDEVSKVIRKNVHGVFEMMDVPTRREMDTLQRKLDHLEKSVDRVGKKIITVKSLKKIKNSKSS